MSWISMGDYFHFDCAFVDNPPVKLTRRVILSVYSRIFDPLGFVQPFILQPKLIIQELCRLGLSWDEVVPVEIAKEWGKWLTGINKVSEYNFPRCIVKYNEYDSAELHIFCDASRVAYAVTCFGRFVYSDGRVVLSFLFGKCKVSPSSGELSIPRLELVAASLATRVACMVLQENNVKFERVLYWTDSTAVLHLIRNNTRRLGVFVDARLAEIHGSSSVENWHYVPTAWNCSDVGTRVISPKNKKKFLPWFEGPAFLLAINYEFPMPPNANDEVREAISSLVALSDIKNERKMCCLSPLKKFASFIEYYSEFNRLIRSLCYVFRVVRACVIKDKKERKHFLNLSASPLTVKERNEAEIFIIRSVQRECFGELYEYICSLKGEVCFKVKKI